MCSNSEHRPKISAFTMHRVRPALARRYLSTQVQASSETSTRGSAWKTPLAPGRIPAYDEALLLIQRDAEVKRAQLQELRQSKPEGWEKKVAKLEIESEVNLPEVRWKFKKGQCKFLVSRARAITTRLTRRALIFVADMTKPVYRHLLEKKWRNEGRLDKLVRNACSHSSFHISDRSLDAL